MHRIRPRVRRVAYHRFFNNGTSINHNRGDWDIGKDGRNGIDEVLYTREIDCNMDHPDEKTEEGANEEDEADGFVSVCHDDSKNTR